MLADQILREGRVDEALAALQEQARKDPSNSKYRTFLFQLLCVSGQWERAMTQLKVLGEMDAATLPMVQAYREALNCEVLRAEVFAGKRSPLVFGEPEPWIALMIEALRCTAGGEHDRAGELRDSALEDAPPTEGKVDGRPFAWIADADSRLGPVLEAIVNGRYYWIPFHRIRCVDVEKPEDLRDLVWTPAHFVWANGGQVVALVPTRYPGSEGDEDDAIRLARKTEWIEAAGGAYVGRGQRMLATDEAEFPLLDTRRIELEVESASSGDTAPEAASE